MKTLIYFIPGQHGALVPQHTLDEHHLTHALQADVLQTQAIGKGPEDLQGILLIDQSRGAGQGRLVFDPEKQRWQKSLQLTAKSIILGRPIDQSSVVCS